jgi:hypothetical protein
MSAWLDDHGLPRRRGRWRAEAASQAGQDFLRIALELDRGSVTSGGGALQRQLEPDDRVQVRYLEIVASEEISEGVCFGAREQFRRPGSEEVREDRPHGRLAELDQQQARGELQATGAIGAIEADRGGAGRITAGDRRERGAAALERPAHTSWHRSSSRATPSGPNWAKYSGMISKLTTRRFGKLPAS